MYFGYLKKFVKVVRVRERIKKSNSKLNRAYKNFFFNFSLDKLPTE